MYDFPSCEKRYTLKCGDVSKAFFFFFFFAVVVQVSFCCCCRFLKKKKKKKEKKEVSVFMKKKSRQPNLLRSLAKLQNPEVIHFCLFWHYLNFISKIMFFYQV